MREAQDQIRKKNADLSNPAGFKELHGCFSKRGLHPVCSLQGGEPLALQPVSEVAEKSEI